MPSEWLTLTHAARQMGVAPWRLRRLVRDGRIHGELRRGRHGPQYYVPAAQLEALHEAVAAELIESAPTLEELIARVDGVVEQRQGEIASELQGLRADLADAVQAQAEREAALRAELEQIRSELAAGLAALRATHVVEEEPKGRPWWRFW